MEFQQKCMQAAEQYSYNLRMVLERVIQEPQQLSEQSDSAYDCPPRQVVLIAIEVIQRLWM